MMRLVLMSIAVLSGCVQYTVSPEPVAWMPKQVSPQVRAELQPLLPPVQRFATRSIIRVELVEDDWLINNGVKPGDVLVADQQEHRGSDIRIFRKTDGKWKQVTQWSDIH